VVCTQPDVRPGTPLVALTDAVDATAAGAKAAALARAAAAGIPVLPGFVLTTDGAAAIAGAQAGAADETVAAVRAAWAELSEQGSRSLVVRSSSTVEDGADSSMAGRFTSVLDVRGWDGFVDAVRTVVRSGEVVHEGLPVAGRMAVLVQRFLEPEAGGVMFGADPVTGRRDRLVVAAVPGGPDQLVSGEVDGVTVTLTRRGKVVESTGRLPAVDARRRELVALAARAAEVFGGPQDVEWAITDGRVVMLQSRPITATGDAAEVRGPVFGPGPVAETFPDALAPLEHALWVEPMVEAIREVLTLTGAASAKRLATSPVVVNVGGQVAVDLELLGVELPAGARSFFAKIDPRPPARRLKVAWQVGRLRAALPGLARDLVEEIDAQLGAVPAPAQLSDRELLALLDGARVALRAAYGYEMLAGQLLDVEGAPVTAAAAALRVLAQERRDGVSDAELVATHPVLLSLVPPSIGGDVVLPPVPATMPPAADVDERQLLREALRLRARWLQELTARTARELGRRLVAARRLSDALAVGLLTLDELRTVVRGEAAVVDLTSAADIAPAAPLPARFRLTPEGTVVALRAEGAAGGDGRGAGGGRGQGVVLPADALPADGAVLVVRTLDPGLAPLLPGLRGLVAETGSVLSHLAILAREFGVPTVVGVEDALRRFPPGTEIVVDGGTGEVAAGASREVAA
jgi:pyruvate,water dikinase